VDSPKKLTRYAARAGLTVKRAELRRILYRWPLDNFMGWVSTMGPYGRRLTLAEPKVRARALDDLEDALRALPPEAFDWTPEIVLFVGVK
jgi:hypothetical protein